MLMDCEQSAEGEVAALHTLLAHRVDGLLVSTVGIDRDVFEDVVGRRGVPCVFFDSAVPEAGDGSVLLDNAAGIELLVDHMVGHGHARIGLLAGSTSETSGHERPQRLPRARSSATASTRRRPRRRRALDARGRPPRRPTHARPRAIRRPRSSPRASSSRSAGSPPPASSASTSPSDVALATFDDAYFAELLDPPLTAVAYDPAEVGRRAAALLVDAMRDGEPDAADDVRIPVSLVTPALLRVRRRDRDRPRDPPRRRLEALRAHARAPRDRPRDRRGRVLLPARPVGLRQDDDAEPDRRVRQPVERRDLHPRRARRREAAAPAQRQHRLPVATRSSRT